MYQISVKEFKQLSTYIQDGYGIKMPLSKKTMLQARLQKRLRNLGFSSFREYCNYVFSQDSGGTELIHMIDAVTTNKTDFFREPHHFNFLKDTALPALLESMNGTSRRITAWSAGCSTGEEPYTLAMVLDSYLNKNARFPFSIMATDISTQVLEIAKTAVYSEDKVAPVPYDCKQQYLMRSKNREKKVVRIVPELRKIITFKSLNLMDESYDVVTDMMDFIFCRNVIIYFERQVQAAIITKLVQHLRPMGLLFLGHSETVFGLDLPLKQVSSTTYQKLPE